MATLQKIRNKGTLLILIVGTALFAFIIGGAIQNSSSYFAQSANTVGEIDGEPISYEEYRKQIGINIQEAESQRGGLSSKERDALEVQTWNQMVERRIVGKEMNELGIKVTSDELSHIFTNKTDNTVQQAFGSASPSEIAALVAETEASSDVARKAQLNRFKEYIKEKRANEKYFTLLSQGLKATDNLVGETSVDGKISFKYIMRSYNTIADSTVDISDSELKEYYNNHKEMFKQVPSREIAYVKIDVEPSDEDKAYATKVIEDIKQKFANAKEPLRFASVNSEIQPNGRYLKREEIQDSELATFAFSGNEGVYGPYGDGLTLQITRVADTQMLPDSVRASHILIAPAENTQQTVDSLMNLLKNGVDFETVARTNSIDKNSAVNGGDLGWFKKGMMVPAFEQAAFETKAGELTTVQTQFGTHIIKVAKRSPLNKNVQLATITKETSASNKTFQLALTEARHIAESANSIDELRAVAKEKNIIVNESTFTAASMGLPDVDNSKELVRAAFRAENEDELIVNNNKSTVFEMEDSYIIAGLKKIREGEYASLDDEKVQDYIKTQLRKEKKAKMLKEELANSLASASTLDALATKEGVEIQEATNASFNNSFVSGLGQEPAVVSSAIFSDKSNKLSQPIKGNQGVFVLSDIVVDESDSSNSQQTISLYNNMLKQRVQMAYQALFNNAEISDLRYKF